MSATESLPTLGSITAEIIEKRHAETAELLAKARLSGEVRTAIRSNRIKPIEVYRNPDDLGHKTWVPAPQAR